MRLLLIRHGQTPSNVIGALDTTVPGPGLTDLGLEQAAAIPGALAGEEIGALFASTQLRAQLTAQPLARSTGLELQVRDGLKEISAGDLEMRNDWDAVVEYHRTSFAWINGDLDERIPGGEDGHEALGRFDDVVDEVAARAEGTVAMVAHGQVIRVWAAARGGVSVDFASENPLHNTGVVVLKGDPASGWEVLEWAGTPLGGEKLDAGISGGPGGTTAPVE
ncbi:probable phosphoglycerate mutase [Paramicrobacterium humi]|uniref:Probable phosphoglycerate mutase n=1 Tax=Paramicrobacterium humi TaxID=640635 RepID=A0A1H4NVN0_9MICO|nr:histidine phosphatase family protein [Microbacterium humi]SEB99224.1 probable phosphoglycerate mutase [Microbacterium humi]